MGRWSPIGCAAVSSPTRRRSTSSTATTATSISRVSCSCRSASPTSDEIVRPRRRQLRQGITFHERTVEEVQPTATRSGSPAASLPYDVLVVATGARLQPEETEGLRARAGTSACSPSTAEGAEGASAHARVVRRGPPRREPRGHADQVPGRAARVRVPRRLVPPRAWGARADASSSTRRRSTAPSRSPSPRGSSARCSAEKEIELVTEFNAGEVDGVGGVAHVLRRPRARLRPARHGPAARRSRLRRALARARRRARVRPHRPGHAADRSRVERVRARRRDRPADLEGGLRDPLRGVEALVENVARYFRDEELQPGYDGHANCFVETGFGKALLIDFNYETEPLPGHYPLALGLPLLRESRLNHLGKLAFEWIYWHALLPGRELPVIGPAMPTAGKRRLPVGG